MTERMAEQEILARLFPPHRANAEAESESIHMSDKKWNNVLMYQHDTLEKSKDQLLARSEVTRHVRAQFDTFFTDSKILGC